MTPRPKTVAEQKERLIRRYSIDPNTGCWNWDGAIGAGGYGKTHIWVQGKSVSMPASRAVFMAFNRIEVRLPREIQICHKCNNRRCINPDHLYAGNASMNQIDSVKAGSHHLKNKTKCSRGHEFTPENTYNPPGATNRMCRKCRNYYVRLAKKKSLYRSRRNAEKRAEKFKAGKITPRRFAFYNRRSDVKAIV